MSSYNFLRAVSDGLAEAIRYRTNLKRQRRENEYNYNRDWQRNENEYQRDLQRKRDENEFDYKRDLQRDEEAYKIKRGRTKQEKQEKIQEAYDFLNNKYYGKEFNTPQQIQDFNFEAIASQQPFSVAMPKATKLSEQIALEELKQRNRIDLQKMKNAARGGSTRQPRAMSEIEAFAKNPELMKNFWEAKYGVRGGSPKAVKGGSGNGAVVGEYNWEGDNLYKYIQDINTTRKAISDQILRSKIPDTAKQLLDKIIGIQFETEDEKKKVIEQYEELTRGIEKNEKQALDYHFNNLLATENYLNNLLRKKTNGKYQWDRNLNDFYNVEERKAKADLKGKAILENKKKENSDLLGKSTRPINIPPAIQPQNNPPVSVADGASVSVDTMKYLRGEMSALEFQQLHPNYPLPQRYY